MNIEDHNHHPQNPKWSVDLCSACGVGGIRCCITWCLPCITFGEIAEIVDEGQSSCVPQCILYCCLLQIWCHWFYSCIYRGKMRKKFGLPDEPCCDCCVHFCCEPCALCQEYAELKQRGFDPSQGHIGPPTVRPQMPPSMFR